MIRTLLAAVALAATLAAPASATEKPWPDARFSVEVRGRGPDVVLIPGLASSRTVWSDTAARLEKTHRVHLVQVAGFAGEPAGLNADGPVVAPLVEDLARYLREKHLERPAVIGHSLGGEAGLALAARHPDLVDRLMVVDALSFFSLLFGPQATPESVRPQADQFRDAILKASDAQFAAMQTRAAGGYTKTEARRPEFIEASLATDRGVMARAAHELMVTDLRPELERVKAKTTVLYAWDDSLPFAAPRVDALYRSAYANLPSASLVRVDGSYHFVMWDQSERFAAEVEAFLAR